MYNEVCIYNKVCNLKETEKCNNECLRYIEITNLLNKSKIPKNMQKTIDLYPDNCDYDSFVNNFCCNYFKYCPSYGFQQKKRDKYHEIYRGNR